MGQHDVTWHACSSCVCTLQGTLCQRLSCHHQGTQSSHSINANRARVVLVVWIVAAPYGTAGTQLHCLLT
jgi:hypothetical protein